MLYVTCHPCIHDVVNNQLIPPILIRTGSLQKLIKYIQDRTQLQASVLPEPEGIVLRKVWSNKCTKEFLNMYFNNRYMSGGREVKNVTILPNEEVIVTFRNSEGEVIHMHICMYTLISLFVILYIPVQMDIQILYSVCDPFSDY